MRGLKTAVSLGPVTTRGPWGKPTPRRAVVFFGLSPIIAVDHPGARDGLEKLLLLEFEWVQRWVLELEKGKQSVLERVTV